MAGVIRIVLADDERMIGDALAALLDLQPDLTVVAQVGDGHAAVAAAIRHRPDIVLLDLEMPGLDGIQAAQAIRTEWDVPIVLVTRHARPGILKRALTAGVRGFVAKTTPATRLADILRDVHSGGRYVDPDIAASALTEAACPLTAREVDVLRHARTGDPIATIADSVGLAQGTVRNYLSSAMTKLGARTRHEAARLAWTEGWI